MEPQGVWSIVFHPFAMLWAGQVLHFLKLMRDQELLGQGKGQGARAFIKDHKYGIMFSLIAGMVAYGFLHTSGQLNVAGAFTAGYMADSVVNSITNRTLKQIEKE